MNCACLWLDAFQTLSTLFAARRRTARRCCLTFVVVLGSSAFLVGLPLAQDKSLVIASTTSAKDSGLFDQLLPLFTRKTGIAVKVLALGTGQALEAGRLNEVDLVFVNAKSAEQTFLAEGHGVKRYPVMYNDFVLIGPKSDPAGVKGMTDVAKAFKTIKDQQATFISRGDHSGTHLAEIAIWNTGLGVDIEEEHGAWYKPVARGMIATLHMARVWGGYALSDRGTWISLEDHDDLGIMVEGGKQLFNQYSVILVDPLKHPNVKKDLGQQFIDWLVSPEGQKAIADYKIEGKQLFYPGATDSQP